MWSLRRIHGEHTCDKRTLKKWRKAKKFTREVEDKQTHANFKVNRKQRTPIQNKAKGTRKEFKGYAQPTSCANYLCVILV